MFKRILLAVDGSEHSKRATNEAVKIASIAEKCVVEIVLVADHSEAKTEILHAQGKEALYLKRRQEILGIEEQLTKKQVNYEVNILHGDPGPIIVEHANKGNFDMVIIGSRGLNSLQKMVLGSVSHKVAKRVNSPVLIVK